MSNNDIKSLGSFVWSIAELLRGDFKQSEYGKVVLPFVMLRCLDYILVPTKDAVLSLADTLPDDMDEIARSGIRYEKDSLKAQVDIPPLHEQWKFAETLSTWDRAIETTKFLLVIACTQKCASMQQFLTGKRRVQINA